MQFKPKIATILNISEDHLNRHKTFENYIEAKARILENQDENDYAVINYDDPIAFSLAKRANGKVIFLVENENWILAYL